MCGRYTLYHSKELKDRYSLGGTENTKLLSEIKDRYNIAPSQTSVVIVQSEDGSPQIKLMKWGFMPPWGKDPKDIFKYSTFNARAEGIFEKTMWKGAIKHHRCLIPSTGFYEWQKRDDGKQPFLIKPEHEEIFSFAGIYSNWKDSDGNEWGTYSIITTTPNSQMESIHNRMPVILPRDVEMTWIDVSLDDPDAIMEFLKPFSEDKLEIFEVSRDVNAAKVDGSALVIPINSK